MTAYSDIPEVNTLYAECEKVDTAIKMIDDGTGTMTHFTIGPKPPPPNMTPTAFVSPVQIMLPNPAQQTTVDEIRVQLVTYQNDLVAQLTALGVTAPPVKAV
jgi:hypothetical protein